MTNKKGREEAGPKKNQMDVLNISSRNPVVKSGGKK